MYYLQRFMLSPLLYIKTGLNRVSGEDEFPQIFNRYNETLVNEVYIQELSVTVKVGKIS